MQERAVAKKTLRRTESRPLSAEGPLDGSRARSEKFMAAILPHGKTHHKQKRERRKNNRKMVLEGGLEPPLRFPAPKVPFYWGLYGA